MKLNSYGYKVTIMVPSILLPFIVVYLPSYCFQRPTENGLVAENLTEKGFMDRRK